MMGDGIEEIHQKGSYQKGKHQELRELVNGNQTGLILAGVTFLVGLGLGVGIALNHRGKE